MKKRIGFVAGLAVLAMGGAAQAGSQGQSWSAVSSPYNSATWYSGATGTHTLRRTSCTDNHPATFTTSYRLWHQRGGFPDEDKASMGSGTCNNTDRSFSGYSNDTQNHYWKQSFNYGSSYDRLSGAGTISYP